MRRAMLAALTAAVAAACGGQAPEAPSPARVAHEATVRPDCYTVDLFSPAPVTKPEVDVPEDWRGYSGRWGGAGWDGKWCHDLHVLEIAPDGEATVIEAHAPFPEWGKPVTAFRRQGRIGKDGHLRLDYGSTKVDYWLEDGKLFGVRTEGDVRRRIMMTRESTV